MPEPQQAPRPDAAGQPRPASYGNLGDRHGSRARAETNRDALEYYRERSKAPGVAEGGAERNFYCMRCDGVIAYDHRGETCPHCGAALDEHVKRYFNWVEINEPPASDARALLLPAALGLVLLAAAAVLLWRWLT